MNQERQIDMRRKSQSFMSMKRINELTSRDPNKKRHCPQDIACLHCCQCWLKFKDQYNKRVVIFEKRVVELTSQNDLLKRCIQRLTNESGQLRIRIKSVTDIETIKENLKRELQREMDEERRIKDLIREQKIVSLTENVKNMGSQINELSEQREKLAKLLYQETKKYQDKLDECDQLRITFDRQVKMRQEQIKVHIEKNTQLSRQLQSLQQRVTTMGKALKMKEDSISQLKSTLDHSDRLITSKIFTLAEKEFEQQKLHMESASKSQQLFNMQKLSQHNSKSIMLLSNEKKNLNYLVDSLKDQLIETDKHNMILKIALNDAEYIANEKSISLENLKFDVSMLKYTLP